MKKKNIIAIVGPTASGKSDLAILLAREHHGEIVSADSRQVYRGMDIGTGKVTKRDQRLAPHHLLDVVSPKRTYNVTHFIRDARKALRDIHNRGKIAIICGGTGFWVQSLLEGSSFPQVKPDMELRKKLGKKTAGELFKLLQRKDPHRAKTIDSRNKIRLIRALEIIEILGKVPEVAVSRLQKEKTFILALSPDMKILRTNIKFRLEKRLKRGMIKEVDRLRQEGLSWKRLESFGLEYKNLALFLQKKLSREEMKERILIESRQYAKRQLSYLRRWEKQGSQITWAENKKEALAEIKKALV